ncbi:hypothetical protein [Streptomyces koyangensis]|uniref:hypothetical protein n=1 Tax=Streptomyces koyangensis TaxID=188770 RepID=UPI003C3016ED
MTTPDQPQDYRLLLPDGWFRVPLEPEARDRSVNALVEQRFEGVDNAPHVKEELRRDLRKRASKAYRNGGIELYLSLQQAGPVTVPASLLVTLAPLPHRGGLPLEALAQRLSEGKHTVEVGVGELPSGPAVRVISKQRGPVDEETGRSDISVGVDYHLPVPGAEAFLLLSFSTPLEPLEEAMTGLFDAVADTFAWVGEGVRDSADEEKSGQEQPSGSAPSDA